MVFVFLMSMTSSYLSRYSLFKPRPSICQLHQAAFHSGELAHSVREVSSASQRALSCAGASGISTDLASLLLSASSTARGERSDSRDLPRGGYGEHGAVF
jgi:hypothetical protein